MTPRLAWLIARMTPRRRMVAGLAALAVLVALAVSVAAAGTVLGVVAMMVLVVLGAAGVVLGILIARRMPRVTRSPQATDPRGRFLAELAVVPDHLIAAHGMSTRSLLSRERLVAASSQGDLLPRVLLARTLASQNLSSEDAAEAARIAASVAADPRVDELRHSVRGMLLDRLVLAREFDLAQQVLDVSRRLPLAERFVLADLRNPWLRAESGDEGLWLATVNAIFADAGLEEVRLAPGAGAPLDRLECAPTSAVRDGPLVSIIMTCFRPGPELETAVRSVQAQTWQNWELLLVDDGSGPQADALLDAIAGRDPRIRLIRRSDNRGTYERRNEALDLAVGEFVTMHDADDWTHPRRIELQGEHLLSHPRLLANLAPATRVTPDLAFVQPRGSSLRLAESSLLFRRRPVLDRVGYFDQVRRAADTGFRHRVEAAGGPVPVLDVPAPLALMRYDADSLSGSDLRDGWTHPARVAYSSAHAAWLAGARGPAARLDVRTAPRPFPAHPHVTGEEPRDVVLDLLVVADVRDVSGHRGRHRALDRWLAMIAQNRKVGVLRSESLARYPVAPAARIPLQRLVNDGRIVEVLPGDRVRAAMITVPDECCLMGLAPLPTTIAAGRVVVGRSSRRNGSGGIYWLREESLAAARRLVPGVEPVFVDGAAALESAAEAASEHSHGIPREPSESSPPAP